MPVRREVQQLLTPSYHQKDHALAAGLRVYVRWIPPELNTADKDSRWFSKMPSSHAIAKKRSKREVTVSHETKCRSRTVE